MKLEHLQAGDVVVLDDGYDCMPAGRAKVEADVDGRLFVSCAEGRHLLEGQLREDGHLSGVFWPGQIEEQAAFLRRMEAAAVPAPWRTDAGDTGAVVADDGTEAVTADVNNALHDSDAEAIAALVAEAVNTLAGWPAKGRGGQPHD